MQFNSNPSVGGQKNFLKIQEGVPVVGVFRGEVYEFFSKWVDKKSVRCDENDPDGRFRFRINFLIRENGLWSAKVWEQGASVYLQLKELAQEYDLEKTFIKIIRSGKGLQTSYALIPSQKQIVNPEMENLLSAVELNDLNPKTTNSSPSVSEADLEMEDEVSF